MVRDFLIKSLPMKKTDKNFCESHIFLKHKLKAYDLKNQKLLDLKSILTKKPSIFLILAISVISVINIPLSPICPLLTWTVKSTFSKEIGSQF